MVAEILDKHPATRDDDKLLLVMFYHTHFGTKDLSVIFSLPNAPSFEAVTRSRRRLQSKGEYPATEYAQELRSDEERQYLAEYGKKTSYGTTI